MSDWASLLDEMALSHEALLGFDGAAFSRHVEREAELLGTLTTDPPASLLPRLQKALQIRRHLVPAMQRTVLALYGANSATAASSGYDANGRVM